jgi:hypothetical protein
MFDAITLSTGDIDFLNLRTMGDSCDLRDKYVEITAQILLRNKEEKRHKKNESSRRSYNKLHKSAKEKVHSENCEAKRKRKLRQENSTRLKTNINYCLLIYMYMFVHCTKRKKDNRQKNQQIQLKFDHTAD